MKRTLIEEGLNTDLYHEESPRPAILIAVAAVVLVGAPLAFANKKIVDEGSRSADVSQYVQLAQQLDGNVKGVRQILEKGLVQEATILQAGVAASQGPTLITPMIMPTNSDEAAQNRSGFNVTLSAIYWSEHDPIVTIDGENYEVGDKVKAYTILEIRKTEVVFRSPAGEKVVKYFYDYLD